MRTTVEFPDALYRELKVRAASEGVPMKEIIVECVSARLQSQGIVRKPKGKLRIPVIRSKNPGSLKLGEEGVYEYIPFP
jgi:hypothetical protein